MRILRLCLHESMTNKQLSDRLGQDPATTLHHVRTLVRSGSSRPNPRERSAGSAREALPDHEQVVGARHPTWSDDRLTTVFASVDALRAELISAGPDALLTSTRLGLQLSDAEAAALTRQLQALGQKYAKRPPTPGGTSVGLFAILHRLG